MNWQTIETAPKDGTDILIYAQKEMFVAFWNFRLKTFVFAMAGDVTFMLETPTHWRPLPEPPEASE